MMSVLLTPCVAACQKTNNMDESRYVGSVRAPEFPEGLPWLNTDRPLRLQELRGKIVLLDFWTYCCINCIHVLPDLKKLEREFDQLVVIGVHSAKFDNERDAENIRQAVLRYDIEHPVVADGEFKLWRQYGIRAWPSFVLIDPEGKVVGQASGEGLYDVLRDYILNISEVFEKKGKLDKRRLVFPLEREKGRGGLLSFPSKIETDGKRLFITDSNHDRIVVCTPQGEVLDVIGSGLEGREDGDFDRCRFFRPQGTAYDAQNDALYIADTENHLVRRADFATRTVTTVAGTGVQNRRESAAGPGLQTALNSPWDLAFWKGELYIAMAGPHQIWRFDPKTGRVENFAGSGREDIIDG
ncbi:MAG: thioredoxin-like domain-containing protein, partial [Bacteroidia bacterium]|nr:thioredoxin-like domain-containing protein [Bacteroidia bacterium]MDW8333980.1 thioredoxin-like domain-containing protein [Bacteroidia bacterium]